ncbi:MAG: acyloxyacyl hydrolase [Bacteroidales bacterium]|jgi:hypothetical protein|nr:acyloxyacyl hydrolase [Bacteroidales bacterium]
MANVQQGNLLFSQGTDVIKNYYVGLELRFGIQTDDYQKNTFDASFRYPKYGIAYYMGNMNEIILGDEHQDGFGKPSALYGFFSSPIFRTKWFQLNYEFGIGVSYNFKTYDPRRRPYNTLIGSKTNGYISASLDGQILLPGHSSIGLGGSFRHFSNGSIQKPNSGINLIMATVSYQWGLYKNRDKSYTRIHADPVEPTLEWYISWGNAVRMLDTDFDLDHPKNSKRWYCATVSTSILAHVSHRRKVGLGLDFFYFDWGRHIINYRAHIDGRRERTSIHDNMSIGVHIAHEVAYKKFWAVTNVGFYLNERVGDIPSSPFIYERIGVKYQLTDRFCVGLSLKAHLVKADYLALEIGYSIIKNKKLKKRS